MTEECNPIARQAAAAITSATHIQSPLELQRALVGPGGRAVQPFTIGRRLHALLGWLVLRVLVLFLVLTAAAWVVQRWPDALWCQAATWISRSVEPHLVQR